MDDELTCGLVAELHRDSLARLDLDGLGRIIQQVAVLGPGFLYHQRGSRLHPFYQEGACAVCHKFAVAVSHHGSVCRSHKELNVTQRSAVAG